ncbi:MAG: D-alanyl-D-alanine carboxypeptidase family protein [Cellulosilyticaceae bacterium]
MKVGSRKFDIKQLKEENSSTLILKKEGIHSGSLILVNKEHSFKHKEVELLALERNYFEIYGTAPCLIHKEMKQPLLNLIDVIKGRKKLVAVSGFRSEDEQKEIYTASILENGRAFTQKYVARPRESEHQTGLAIDLGEVVEAVDFICPSFPDNGICKTFKDLATTYGFIMRYSHDKENITHIAEERWHFRYVGMPHAKIIKDYQFCLEEYIDFLRKFKYKDKHLIVVDKDIRYELFCVPMETSFKEIKVSTKRCHISGNNVDGFVVTLAEKIERHTG